MYPCSVAQKRQLRQHLAADERKGLIGLSGPTADEQMIGSANRSELSLVTIVPLFLFADQSFAFYGLYSTRNKPKACSRFSHTRRFSSAARRRVRWKRLSD